jgi:hypothetical protein
VSYEELSDKEYQCNCAIYVREHRRRILFFVMVRCSEGLIEIDARTTSISRDTHSLTSNLYQKGETMKQIHWHDDLNSGLELARRDHKHVLLDFHNSL